MTVTVTPTDLPDVEVAPETAAELARVCELCWGFVAPGLFDDVITTEACTASAVCQVIATCGRPKQHVVTRAVCEEHRDDVAVNGMRCVVDACGRESRVVAVEAL